DGKRRTLGGGSTGGSVAVPIFEPVIQAGWAHVVPKAALAPPSPEAKRYLTCKSVELDTGEAKNRRGRALSECFRLDAKGKVRDTQYVLVSRESTYVRRGENNGNREGTPRKTSERSNTFYDGNPSRGKWGSQSENGQPWTPQWRSYLPSSFWTAAELSTFSTAAFNSSGDTPNFIAVPAMLLTEAIRCSE